MNKVYTEIGFGNESFFSTEIEEKTKEYRLKKFILPKKILGIYLRFWIFKKVLVISSVNGISVNKKDKNKIKLLLGIEGKE
ncbi:MAG: DUF3977 family protein [Nanoarchaeota archaeon]|nr:DUF3977 family protein [Nanoarchaeota archaeon]